MAGYIVGALDTAAFEALLEERWWPTLRPFYADPAGKSPAAWNADEVRAWQIHHPRLTPSWLSGPYPSHLHINLLPRLQGQGVGRALMDHWLTTMRDHGSVGAHLGVGTTNQRATRFYNGYGWRELQSDRPAGRTKWYVMPL